MAHQRVSARHAQGAPTLLESRTRFCYEAITRGWVNPNLLREEDAVVRELIKDSVPSTDRLYIPTGSRAEANTCLTGTPAKERSIR